MKPKHVNNYYKAHGLSDCDTPLCQLCGKQGQEVHHIEHRQKNNPKLDQAWNLICLCRDCHIWAHNHNSRETKNRLLKIVEDSLNV